MNGISLLWFGIITRRLRRFNAEAQRVAESRRGFISSAFLRVPRRLCVESLFPMILSRHDSVGLLLNGERQNHGRTESCLAELSLAESCGTAMGGPASSVRSGMFIATTAPDGRSSSVGAA